MALRTPYEGFAYHPHQVTAVNWMMGREQDDAPHVRGGILADEMGLGKTWMTIGLLLNSVVHNTLLLVPPMLQPQWSEALTRSSIPHRILAPAGATGTVDGWRPIAGTADCMVYIATYDRATHNIALLTGAGMYFDRIICDEGHVLRNGPKTRRFLALSTITAERKWILSGTPVQNRKQDFLNLLNFLGMDAETRLRIDPVVVAQSIVLRRTVGDVRDVVTTMPSVKPVHVTHSVTMPPQSEEERVFKALVGRFNYAIESHAKALIILELYLRIRQFIAHPSIYVDAMKKKYGDKYGRPSWTGTASKMAEFTRLVSTGPKPPTIVFGTFRGEMDFAHAELVKAGYHVWDVRGGMTDAQRELVCEASRAAVADGRPVAIVVQIVAGGAGLNLQHCSRVVFLSSHWNPAVVDQAIARAYRMGQTETVYVHHLLLADDAEKNVDRRMIGLHGVKRGIAVKIHPKLFCDSAADSDGLIADLNSSLPPAVGPAAYDPGLPELVAGPIEAEEDPN